MLQMLVALHLRKPTLLHESMVSIGAVDPIRDPEDIERALAQFMATYLAPGLPPAEALVDLLRVTSGLGVRLPRSATVMFRALATLAGMLEQLCPGYPIIEVIAELGGRELQQQYAPTSLRELVQQEGAQLAPLLRRNDEIGAALFMSPATAKTHVSRTMTKLAARDRVQLVIIAYETGLVHP